MVCALKFGLMLLVVAHGMEAEVVRITFLLMGMLKTLLQ